MTIKHIIPSLTAVCLLFTGCMTSEKWVDDDVYVLKTVEIPTDTDVSDETDYNAFVYNQHHSRYRVDYYSTFFYATRPAWVHPYYTMGGVYNRPFGNYGWYYGYGGYYDPFGYGYGYNYDPYWGYFNTYNSPYYYNSYGYTNFPCNPGYNGPWAKPISTGLHVSGPRGSSSGYGGVRSNSPFTYKSAQTNPGTPSGKNPRTVNESKTVISKPVNSYDRAGRSTPATSRPVNAQPAGRENVTEPSGAGSGRTINTQPAARPQQRVVRPASTTSRTENGTTSNGSGRTLSPARTNGGTINGGASENTPRRTISNDSNTPRGNSGTSSGSSGSSRSGGSSSGSHTGGRRP